MLAQVELKRIANARLADAESLFSAKRYDGALYLCGYAVEIALKLRICKTLKWLEFPESNAEFRDLNSFKTHDLNVLLRLSGVEAKIKSGHLVTWSILVRWKPELRYSKIKTVSSVAASDMISATRTLLKLL